MTEQIDSEGLALIIDSYESLRATALGALRSELTLLSDAQKALSKGKTHIAADLLDRAIEGLTLAASAITPKTIN